MYVMKKPRNVMPTKLGEFTVVNRPQENSYLTTHDWPN
jgi:hypothetical protein